MSDYRPIACSSYDLFEIAIMRGQRLQAQWQTAGGDCCKGSLRPVGLKVRDGAEWLWAENDAGTLLELRLDRVESAGLMER